MTFGDWTFVKLQQGIPVSEEELRRYLQSLNLIPTDRDYRFAGVERLPGTSGLIQRRKW